MGSSALSTSAFVSGCKAGSSMSHQCRLKLYSYQVAALQRCSHEFSVSAALSLCQ